MYVGVHSTPWKCLEILKTNHSTRNFLEHRNFKKPITLLEILIKMLRYLRMSFSALCKIKESASDGQKTTESCLGGVRSSKT